MPKGYSLHIGLNHVKRTQYGGWDGRLLFAEADAIAMLQMARQAGYAHSYLLLGELATRSAVLSRLKGFARTARKDDLVFISFSGHGAALPDKFGPNPKEDVAETWCCYDGQLLDKELLHAWSLFQPGVRIVLLSDSCFSGDIVKAEDPDDPAWQALQAGAKFLSLEKSLQIYKSRSAFYDKILAATPRPDPAALPVRVKQFAACEADGFSFEGEGNGVFTAGVLSVWRDGAFWGNYADFFKALPKQMDTRRQRPVFQNIGGKDAGFDGLRAFAVEAPAKTGPRQERTNLLVSFKTGAAGFAKNFGSADFQNEYAVPGGEVAVFAPKGEVGNPWDMAHALYTELKSKKTGVLFVEPEMNTPGLLQETASPVKSSEHFVHTWPHPQTPAFDPLWHLGPEFSNLGAARDLLMNDPALMADLEKKPLRIAHLDTGFFPYKDFMPERLQVRLGRSFVPGESENLAVDFDKKGVMPEQQGHGALTLALLAGPRVDIVVAGRPLKGYIGAVPFAEIIPIRIQDSAALLKTSAFERAVYYAIEQGCEVISMSMAGAPSKHWAKAVDYAYEKGVVIVSAAGNSWRKGALKHLPQYLLYPARFERVIGAAGVTFSQQPYVFDANDWEERIKSFSTLDMQGNHGPSEQMWHIVSGYTPNVLMANTGQENKPPTPHFSMKGGGTSSATPQVAAAAALWVAAHRNALKEKGYTGTWQQTEAVRRALFDNTRDFPAKFAPYLGRGPIDAVKALRSAPLKASALRKAKESEIPFLPLFSTLFGLLKAGPEQTPFPVATKAQLEMLALELAQLAVTEPQLERFGAMQIGKDALVSADLKELRAIVLNSGKASGILKEIIAKI